MLRAGGRLGKGEKVHGLYCDACGEALLVDSNVRYVAKIELYAAYDPLEITEEDLEGANAEAWDSLMEELRGADAEELASQVHLSLRYDLCPACRKRYVADPLRSARGGAESAGGNEP